MFNELVESVAVRKQTKKGVAFAASAAVQLACLVVLLLLPLIYTQALPKAIFKTLFITAAPPTIEPPEAQAAASHAPKPTARFVNHGVMTAPNSIPTHVAMLNESALPPELPANAFSTAPAGGELFDAQSAPATVPAPPKPSNVSPRLKLGGDLQSAKLVSQMQPAYPALAQQARIQGTVILHAVIDKDGRVSELQIISGHPLLVSAALDAVKQWRYRPTLLNEEPVEVETTITVTFSLGR